jgi:hypothetical protein
VKSRSTSFANPFGDYPESIAGIINACAMHIVPMFTIGGQIFWLLMLAIPIATISRTVVFEEIFREPRDWCLNKSRSCRAIWQRKFFYLFTCEYCFSHYVTIFFLILTRFKLLIDDWRGYVLAFFALVLVANAYLNLYSRLRVDIQQAKVETKKVEKEVNEQSEE